MYQVAAWEDRGGHIQESSKRVMENSQKPISLQIKGLPPLNIKKQIASEKSRKLLGMVIRHYQYDLSIMAKEEVIPLNDQEIEINERLRSFKIQKVDLAGKGELWIDQNNKKIVAEKYSLEGYVTKKNKKEFWKLHWARGIEW